jgi:hypothetical protein
MKNKLILTLIVSMFLISLVSANQIASLGTFKQNECIELKQTCADCSYVNFSRVSYPDGTRAMNNTVATKDGSVFNLEFCNTDQLGTYIVEGIGDVEGTDTVFAYDFEITPSGQSGTANIVFFLFIILLLYGITFTGFFGRNIPMTIIGGMAMIFLGVYLINNGIIVFRDNITNYVAYLTISVGAITSFWAILDQLDII